MQNLFEEVSNHFVKFLERRPTSQVLDQKYCDSLGIWLEDFLPKSSPVWLFTSIILGNRPSDVSKNINTFGLY